MEESSFVRQKILGKKRLDSEAQPGRTDDSVKAFRKKSHSEKKKLFLQEKCFLL